MARPQLHRQHRRGTLGSGRRRSRSWLYGAQAVACHTSLLTCCGLTIHSSRRRFAARLNSGVRCHCLNLWRVMLKAPISALLLFLLTGCNQQAPFQAALIGERVELAQETKSHSARPVEIEMANLYAGIVIAVHQNPKHNAIDAYAKGMDWKKIPENMHEMLNAKHGYFGKISNRRIMLLSDGSNDIFSIVTDENFDPESFKESLSGFFGLASMETDERMGQKMDLYQLNDGDREVGVLSIIYGLADSIQGTGTVSFISKDRARKEGVLVR